jgi:hypothetical protein
MIAKNSFLTQPIFLVEFRCCKSSSHLPISTFAHQL